MTADTPLLEEATESTAPSNPTCSGTGVHGTFCGCSVSQQLASPCSQRQMKATEQAALRTPLGQQLPLPSWEEIACPLAVILSCNFFHGLSPRRASRGHSSASYFPMLIALVEKLKHSTRGQGALAWSQSEPGVAERLDVSHFPVRLLGGGNHTTHVPISHFLLSCRRWCRHALSNKGHSNSLKRA